MVVFFDIDDTLVDSESAHLRAIGKICQEYSLIEEKLQSVDQAWLNITNKYLKLYFENQVTLDQQRLLRVMEFWDYLGQQIDGQGARMVYQLYHQLFLHSCYAFTDVISSLESLKACRYKLGVISNGTYSDQLFKLKYNHLISFFDAIIISEKIGFSKPDQKIFQIASRQVQSLTSDCIYVGDTFELDYLGSLNAGMKAIWLDRKNANQGFKGEMIHSLHELTGHPYLV